MKAGDAQAALTPATVGAVLRHGDWRPRLEPTGLEGEDPAIIAEAVGWLDQPGPEPLPSLPALALIHRQHRILRRNVDRALDLAEAAQLSARDRNRDLQVRLADAPRGTEAYPSGYLMGSAHEIETEQAALLSIRDELTNTEPA